MGEPLVLDATPLIYLARVDRLEAGLALADSCLVPEPVHEEVVTAGLEAGYPDTRHIEAAIDAGDLAVKEPPRTDPAERLCDNDGLSDADVSVLALAARADGTAVMDERRGRRVAQVEGITAHGTSSSLHSSVTASSTARRLSTLSTR